MYEPPLPRADSRFAKPRNSLQGRTGLFFLLLQKEPKSTRSVPPDRGKLSACQKVPERETDCYFLRRAKSNTKSTRGKPCDPGSKLYGKIFFVTFLTFVPKPVYGATRFFGCFEPVRKGYCSADARPIFFENGKPHYKLTGANVFEEGSCTLSLLRWEFDFAVCGLKFRDMPKFLLPFKTAAL